MVEMDDGKKLTCCGDEPYNECEKEYVENLVLYHTEDKNIARRKELYSAEGKEYYNGNLYIPDDLEKLEL